MTRIEQVRREVGSIKNLLKCLNNEAIIANAFAAQMRKTACFARVLVADKGLIVQLNRSEI